ncbi:MAG: hypothetical protein ACFB00_07705 [Parvularculaceae bacterium]
MLALVRNEKELRRFRRVALDLPARIVVNGIDDYQGRLVNISPGDLAVALDAPIGGPDGAAIVTGDAAVVSVADLDMFEGRIVRMLPDGFALSFRLPRVRRTKLTEKLMLRANARVADGLGDRRSEPRHRSGDQRTVCRLADGASLFVRILDQSVGGVAVESTRKPPLGSEIHVGRQRGAVIRHTPRGFVVMFERPADLAAETADAEADARGAHLRAV